MCWPKDAGFDSSFPVHIPKDAKYSFKGSADDVGEYFIDSKRVSKSKNWRKIKKGSIELTAGAHTVRLKGMNFFGPPTRKNPASLAFIIRDSKGKLAFDSINADKWAKGAGTEDENKLSLADTPMPPDLEEFRPVVEYTVKKGDTLGKIAKKELGSVRRWIEIYKENRKVIGRNPNRIKPGQVLILIKDLSSAEGRPLQKEENEDQQASAEVLKADFKSVEKENRGPPPVHVRKELLALWWDYS